MIHIDMYADLSCPFAYLVHAHWRRVRTEYAGRISIRHTCLALEYVNRAPTPKATLEAELPVLMLDNPDVPYAPWSAPASEWPVTIWPAFEAVKCGERQGLDLAEDLTWAIRVAFFNESRCISMRHVLLELASRSGLDARQFEEEFDAGTCKGLVVEEAGHGWEELRVPGSPTWVLPEGTFVSDFGLPAIDVDDRGRLIQLGFPGEPSTKRADRMRAVLEGLIEG